MSHDGDLFSQACKLLFDGSLGKFEQVFIGCRYCNHCQRPLYTRFDAAKPLCVHFENKTAVLELTHPRERSVVLLVCNGTVPDQILKCYPVSVYKNRYLVFFSDFLKKCSAGGGELILTVSKMDLMDVESCGRCQKRVLDDASNIVDKRARMSIVGPSSDCTLRAVECAIDWEDKRVVSVHDFFKGGKEYARMSEFKTLPPRLKCLCGCHFDAVVHEEEGRIKLYVLNPKGDERIHNRDDILKNIMTMFVNSFRFVTWECSFLGRCQNREIFEPHGFDLKRVDGNSVDRGDGSVRLLFHKFPYEQFYIRLIEKESDKTKYAQEASSVPATFFILKSNLWQQKGSLAHNYRVDAYNILPADRRGLCGTHLPVLQPSKTQFRPTLC